MGISLVVGGTSGIGLATARRLRDAGHVVHVASRSPERVAAAAAEGLTGHVLDAKDAGAVRALAAGLAPIDHLVVTISSNEGPGPFAELDLAMLRRAFDDKFWGHVTTVQAVLPHLAADASITLLGAISAHTGMPGTAGIAAVNGAVEALVQPLAVELAPIRVNAVSPGLVDTPWWDGLPDGMRATYFEAAAKQLPSRAVATADEVAELVVVAATNRNLTGSVLEADGGARLVTLG